MPFRPLDDAVVLPVRVKPRAPRSRIAGERAGRLVIEVSAAPVDGRANEAACWAVAKALGIARTHVSIVGGQRARDKLVRIEGVPAAEVERELGLSPP